MEIEKQNNQVSTDTPLIIDGVVVRFLRLFKKKCPKCKSRNNTIECYTIEGDGNYSDTGRQCHNCNNFWYS